MSDPTGGVFALLDDSAATAGQPTSRLYQGFAHEHRCADPAELDAMWSSVGADVRAGLHAVLMVDYEWGTKLLKAGHQRLPRSDSSALRVLMFRELSRLSAAEVGAWLGEPEPGHGAATGVMNMQPSVDRAAFNQAITCILDAIAAGETYQVNFTYRLDGQAFGSPLSLYRQLRKRQPVSYGAFIALPDDGLDAAATTHVLSCSPELFLRHANGLLTARPMKGTAARVEGPECDSETARHLSIDIKNRAENLMIVDLLRNDLGRLARIGSVVVPELFAIEPYNTVFQMTSTVQARLRPEVGMPEVLRAAFPCGSITGAPKHHTMELIAGLESTPRGLYCGAIGWFDAPQGGDVCGDFCLSVAIRTLTLGHESHGLRPARLGIGAGIVADSRADDEFDECRLKARFLMGLDPGFELFETMHLDTVHGVRHLSRHLERLARSADVLGFRFDRMTALQAMVDAAASLTEGGPWRLRLTLAHDGALRLERAALTAPHDEPVALMLADVRLPNANPLSAHKTTLRAAYDEGVRAAERAGAFDSLFFTADGRLVEGGRSSVFLKLDGRWVTPPLADGALPGVMRSILLAEPAWVATERSISWSELQRAETLVVCNALRGALTARLRHSATMAA